MEQHQTFCRYCHAYCAMVATVEDGVVESVKPDTTNPIYGGYTCIKGRQLVEQMYQDARLIKPLKRMRTANLKKLRASKRSMKSRQK